MTDKYMEESLNMPMASILNSIQNRILTKTSYFGIKTLQSPNDFWVYQEIIYRTKPDVLIEIGNFCGGSTLALAHIFDAMGHGRIIGLDIDHSKVPELVTSHPRITLIEGDACQSYDLVNALISPHERVLVIEDSSHTYQNTLNVLRLYSRFIKPNDYFIVEDSICHHGLQIGPKPGPYEAIETFINESANFEIDRDQESFLITWNPKGYLKRKSHIID
jgi:cephalosporin hydroxylase